MRTSNDNKVLKTKGGNNIVLCQKHMGPKEKNIVLCPKHLGSKKKKSFFFAQKTCEPKKIKIYDYSTLVTP